MKTLKQIITVTALAIAMLTGFAFTGGEAPADYTLLQELLVRALGLAIMFGTARAFAWCDRHGLIPKV